MPLQFDLVATSHTELVSKLADIEEMTQDVPIDLLQIDGPTLALFSMDKDTEEMFYKFLNRCKVVTFYLLTQGQKA